MTEWASMDRDPMTKASSARKVSVASIDCGLTDSARARSLAGISGAAPAALLVD